MEWGKTNKNIFWCDDLFRSFEHELWPTPNESKPLKFISIFFVAFLVLLFYYLLHNKPAVCAHTYVQLQLHTTAEQQRPCITCELTEHILCHYRTRRTHNHTIAAVRIIIGRNCKFFSRKLWTFESLSLSFSFTFSFSCHHIRNTFSIWVESRVNLDDNRPMMKIEKKQERLGCCPSSKWVYLCMWGCSLHIHMIHMSLSEFVFCLDYQSWIWSILCLSFDWLNTSNLKHFWIRRRRHWLHRNCL